MSNAVDFASTPSGYVITLLVTIALALMGVIYRRNGKDRKEMRESLDAIVRRQAAANREMSARINTLTESATKSNEALAVLIARDTDERPIVAAHGERLGALETAVAILKRELDRHEQWHEREAARPASAG